MSKWRGKLNWSPAEQQSLAVSISACLTGLILLFFFSVVALIVWRGATYFWPQMIYEIHYLDEQHTLAAVYAQVSRQRTQQREENWYLRYSDGETPFDGQVLLEDQSVLVQKTAQNVAEIELIDGRLMFAAPLSIVTVSSEPFSAEGYQRNVERVAMLREKIDALQAQQLATIHQDLAELNERDVVDDAPARLRLEREYFRYSEVVSELEVVRDQIQLRVQFANGELYSLPISDIADVTFPNNMSFLQKLLQASINLASFFAESPKQANTAGGVFPALFGTVLMVFLMTIIVSPFGVLAAIYLNEYAPDNMVTSLIRISVSNMAGVPSVVYGVFGLGFLVYTVGGQLDNLFFADTLPAPTFGSPGLLWASVTMAMLTLPVVIVATEEGLRRVPFGLRTGSYALGATKAETIFNTVLPMASPGIMTGIILAIARAAGEVAPLMIVGAVKYAPSFPLDGEFPFLHLDRQFMHLGVLIYDSAFHSQTDVKSSSMMFATCLLLLMVVLILNIVAILLRTRLRKRYLQG